jgi:hypothetical protein
MFAPGDSQVRPGLRERVSFGILRLVGKLGGDAAGGRVALGWPVCWLRRRSCAKLEKLSGAARPHSVT